MSLHVASLSSTVVILSLILASSDCGDHTGAGTPAGLLHPRLGEVSSVGEAKEATSQDCGEEGAVKCQEGGARDAAAPPVQEGHEARLPQGRRDGTSTGPATASRLPRPSQGPLGPAELHTLQDDSPSRGPFSCEELCGD